MRNCDIIMKGGITSGVVYPLAVVELSREFRFKNVGGTSAGAIAAAVTAAAEYRRVTTGSSDGFKLIEALPDFLAAETDGQKNLLNLFPPTKSTRRLFAVLAAFLGNGSMFVKALRAFGALLVLSLLLTLVAFAPFIVGLFQRPSVGAVFIDLALLLLGLLLLVLFNAIRALIFTIPRNRFGFSTGRAPADRKLPGVTDWLHGRIQEIAGRTLADPPLTFADLWLAGETVANRETQLENAANEADLRSIDLQMMTTALSHGHPYRLPFTKRPDARGSRFSFRESEFREYFPATVVDYLLASSKPDDRDDTTKPYDDLHALPWPWDMPIVVAARMSLSFPVLFCMVPLYAVDFTRTKHEYKRCWFIDGGLSSNFPMSLFDSPFPRWPTFGINLGEFPPDHPKDPTNEDNNVWMVTTPSGGISDHWTEIPDRDRSAIGKYVGAILDAIRNWHDNVQLAVPGFRDRVAVVKLTPDEGGLNLDMDDTKVKSLSKRGQYAARRLRGRFGAAGAQLGSLDWNSHRWTRYKTSMALLQKAMRRMDAAFAATDPLFPSYKALVARTSNANPKTDRWWRSAGKIAQYQALTAEFLALAQKAAPPAVEFDDEAPYPKPELRITPQL